MASGTGGWKREALRLALAAAVALPGAAIAQQNVFEDLGDLPGGADFSVAQDVSQDGGVVVGYSHNGAGVPVAGVLSGYEAFAWTPQGGMVGLGGLPGILPGLSFVASYAYGVSADGKKITGTAVTTYPKGSGSITEAFIWSSQAGMVGLGDLLGGRYHSEGLAISDDGSTVVGYSRIAAGSEAFRWTAATGMVGLGDLPGGGVGSYAMATSADGSVVVGYSLGVNGSEAFRWTAATGMVGLGDLPGGGVFSAALGVSADGSTVVGFASSASGFAEAFRWTAAGGMVGLGDLPGGVFYSYAEDVSADGAVVVGGGYSATGYEAFRWNSAEGLVGMSPFFPAGWSSSGLRGASPAGLTCVGSALAPAGGVRAIRVTPDQPMCGCQGDALTGLEQVLAEILAAIDAGTCGACRALGEAAEELTEGLQEMAAVPPDWNEGAEEAQESTGKIIKAVCRRGEVSFAQGKDWLDRIASAIRTLGVYMLQDAIAYCPGDPQIAMAQWALANGDRELSTGRAAAEGGACRDDLRAFERAAENFRAVVRNAEQVLAGPCG